MTKDEFAPNEMAGHLSPFQESHTPGERFIGTEHLRVLTAIRQDITDRTPQIILTGEDGCGKTVFSQILATELSSGFVTILFDNTLSSFEEMAERIAASLDVEPTEEDGGVDDLIEQIAVCVAVRNVRLLVICDGAEAMFLATLERLRKMMERLNKAVVSMQLILIGRDGVNEQLRQLSICNLEEIEESHHRLAPLNHEDTHAYIEFCRHQIGETESSIFTPEVADRIHLESGGNFRKIHQLGEKLCNRNNKDASFWVLLENVEGAPVEKEETLEEKLTLLAKRYDPRRLPRKQQLIMAGVAGAFLLFMLLVSGGNEQKEVIAEKHVEESPQQIEVEDDSVGEPDPDISVHPLFVEEATDEGMAAEEPLETVSVELETGPVDTEVVAAELVAGDSSQSDGTEITVNELVDPAREQLKQADLLLAEAAEAVATAMRQQGQELHASPRQPVPAEEQIGADVADTNTAIVVQPAKVISQSEEQRPVEQTNDAPMVNAEQVKKVKEPVVIVATTRKENVHQQQPASLVQPDQSTRGEATERMVLARDIERQKQIKSNLGTLGIGTMRSQESEATSSAGSDERASDNGLLASEPKKAPVVAKVIVPTKVKSGGSGIYPSRLAAASSWLNGQNRGKYTLQLMALTSPDAKENIQKTLAQPIYANHADKLYILEKEDDSTVYVFLGEFESRDAAKSAREAIPANLQTYKPYILMVEEAVGKVQ